jgi:hypothetical protein
MKVNSRAEKGASRKRCALPGYRRLRAGAVPPGARKYVANAEALFQSHLLYI